MKIENFKCEEDLTKYTDSMLFNTGTEIASMSCSNGTETIAISLEIRGEVRVTYKGVTYRSPDEFPEDLIALIKKDKAWEYNDDVNVEMGNWFEYIYLVDSPSYSTSDGILYDGLLENETPDEIRSEMEDICKSLCC